MHEDIFFMEQEDSTMPFCVSLCGISYCDSSYHMMRHCSTYNVIEYIISGEGIVSEGNETFTASEGDVYFLKEGHKHYYYSNPDTPWVKIWFNFTGKLAASIIDIYGLDTRAHYKAPDAKVYFDELIELSKMGIEKNAFFEKSAEIFLRLAQHLHSLGDSKNHKIPTIATLLKDEIDNMDDYSVPLDDLIKKTFCSKCHVIREFKKAYGITPYSYILNKKYEIAKTLLVSTALPIEMIADKLSFCDVHYFSGEFKKRFGITPYKFRKQHR